MPSMILQDLVVIGRLGTAQPVSPPAFAFGRDPDSNGVDEYLKGSWKTARREQEISRTVAPACEQELRSPKARMPLVWVCLLASAAQASAQLPAHTTAKQLAQSGKPLEAAQVLRGALATNPSDTYSYANLAAILGRSGDLEAAVQLIPHTSTRERERLNGRPGHTRQP